MLKRIGKGLGSIGLGIFLALIMVGAGLCKGIQHIFVGDKPSKKDFGNFAGVTIHTTKDSVGSWFVQVEKDGENVYEEEVATNA
ncbi:hypothetical protein P13BB106kb_p082 [Pectobacterium phage DU_PP_V]|uniref:Uncharacterized protein n=1 Tax=Pectobacterium phage DU_PP_V TaxID=2041492 RepID=A0A2D2W6Z0_9CAUD|nr:hypothetical protein HOS40_gp087 [Pectobacterium phage DU_PP_V]ATS94066.1 hypothetical protein P13BB106kb_p082 [Pectobacterium phage DU_PP_V]